MAKTAFKSVDEYIATHPEGAQATLQRLRSTIRKALPGAEEGISYQIPTYKLRGDHVVYFAGWKEHYSLYPATGRLVAAFKDGPRTVRGRQGHDPLPALSARPREVDRPHLQVPREGGGRTREGEAREIEEAPVSQRQSGNGSMGRPRQGRFGSATS